MRITKDPEERKEELIETAERLFLHKGYEQTSISDIVREIEVSQGAFYYYFDSKEDILVAVRDRQIASIREDFLKIASNDGLDEAEKINSMANRLLYISASGKRIMGYIEQARSSTLHEKLHRNRPFAEIAPIMAGVIAEGCKKDSFRVDLPLETSYLLLLLMSSANHIFFQRRDREARVAGAIDQKRDSSHEHDEEDQELLENLRAAMQELLARALGVRDCGFNLQI